MKLLSLLALSLALLTGTGLAGEREDLERLVSELDASREPAWTEALEKLAGLGEPAVLRVLEDFRSVGFCARRSRVWLLLEVPAPACIERVLPLLDDPDPQVRRLLCRWLGLIDLGLSGGAERSLALAARARLDSDVRVREAARKALVESALPEAMVALDGLLDELPAEEAADAARRLAELPAARTRVLTRVQRALAEPAGAPADEVLSALLRGYGRALAEVPLGGLEREERLPLVGARNHCSPAVRLSARVALASFVARAAELGEPERAEALLERLGQEGWEPEQTLRQGLDLALLQRGDVPVALERARALGRRARMLPEPDSDFWSTQAELYEGACLFAQQDLPGARAAFARAAARLAARVSDRVDLFSVDGEPAPSGGGLRADRMQLLAVAREWQALCMLGEGRGPDDPGVLGELRAAHELLLRSRAVATRSGAPDPSSLDSLFDRDLGPHVLLLFNDHVAPRERGLELARALASAWATVAPWELPGFEQGSSPDRVLTDPLLDPGRREALQELRRAEVEQIQHELRRMEDRADTAAAGEEQQKRAKQQLRARIWEIEQSLAEEQAQLSAAGGERQLEREALREVYSRLARYLAPTMHALTFAGELRAEGRSEEAQTLTERALADLRLGLGGSSVWSEWASARLEILRGSLFMDREQPSEAERACLDAVRRLEAVENTLGEWRGSVRGQDARALEAQTRMIRELRGNALLSLAVNANVRQGDPAKALEYFERAYELDQSPFMKVLRACYRARSGRAEEARAVLASVVPTPALYYNIACTYALLGNSELALDFLERDLEENHPTAGSRERQREWASKDPDLRSLHGEPRYQRLIGPAQQPR